MRIPNFSYGTPVADLFPAVKAQAAEPEAAGFDTVLLMDHFYQLPGLGEPDEPMLEAYTALGALATATERVQLSTLVTGNTYRNPTLLAKVITTLDVVSAGRAVLGIGAGWFELEHRQLGFDFDTFAERFEKLEEALQIIVPMLHGERPTFDGKWYHTESAINEPRTETTSRSCSAAAVKRRRSDRPPAMPITSTSSPTSTSYRTSYMCCAGGVPKSTGTQLLWRPARC